VADAPVAPQGDAPVPRRTAERVEQARLTTRRLFGLDRSGPPPPETLSGHPLNPWTIPNAIGFVRVALIPVFVWLEFRSDGSSVAGAVIFAVIAWSDYADGMAARITGQYSRLGAILDPVTDRLLIISGVVVCFRYELLPRWALAILIARELFMLVAGRMAMKQGLELRINWPGRLAVWPTMAAIFFALVGWRLLGDLLIYIGLALTLLATAMYVRDGLAEARTRRKRPPTPSS